MLTANTHRDLVAWQEAMKLVEVVYKATATFPKEEVFGLTAQIRRAAVSVPSNIAEGAARNSSREFAQYLGVASGSIAELATQIEIAQRLGYIVHDADISQLADRVGRLVNGLRKSIKNREK